MICSALVKGWREVWCSLQPVCTTEIGRLALKYKELSTKGVKIATLSADPVSHCNPAQYMHPYPGIEGCKCLGKMITKLHMQQCQQTFCSQVDSHSKWLNDVVAHCENGVCTLSVVLLWSIFPEAHLQM